MKKALYGAISLLTFAIAAPATAQTAGTVTGGVGAGLGLGGFTNGAIDTSAVSGTNTQTLEVKIDRELSASSGSGFGGAMNINSVPDGSSYALVGGVGASGTTINADVDAANNGSITSTSFNAGLYGGLTSGNASLALQVMNFGQSSADFKLSTNFTGEHQDEFDNTTLDWTAAGAAGLTGFAFGSLGWNND